MDNGKPCWYRVCKPGTAIATGNWLPGQFQQFSEDHIEYDSGPGPIPVAIIVDNETQHVVVVYARYVAFGDEAPGY